MFRWYCTLNMSKSKLWTPLSYLYNYVNLTFQPYGPLNRSLGHPDTRENLPTFIQISIQFSSSDPTVKRE